MAIESIYDYEKRLKKNKKQNIQNTNKFQGIESIDDFAKRNNVILQYNPNKKKSGLFKSSDAFDDGWQAGDLLKTVGSTAGDLAVDIAKGFMYSTEGVADTLQYGTAGVLDFFGADNAANAVRENAKFNSSGAIFGENENPSDNLFKKGWAERLDKNSLIGDFGDSVAQGVGNVAALAGMGVITGGSAASSFITSFASGYGSARSQAYENGADDKTAHTSGLINGLAEAISEQFFNGIPGMKTAGWGEKLTGKIGGGISKFLGSKTGKIAMKILDYTGEGGEEIISNILTTTGNNIAHLINNDFTYGMEDSRLLKDGYQFGDITKDNFDAVFSKESLESFISASLTSALIGGASSVITNTQKNSILKSYAEDNGITLEEAKTQLESTVNAQMKENSNLPLNEQMELEDKLQQDQLTNMKRGIFVEQGQQDQAFQFKETDNEQVNNMLKNLSEKGSNSVENHATAQMAEKLIRDIGCDVEFVTSEELKALNREENAAGYKEGNKIVLNLNSNELASFVMGHETTHFLEQEGELYEAVSSAVFELAKTRGKYDGDIEKLSKTYEKVINNKIKAQENDLGRSLTEDEIVKVKEDIIKSELTANYVGNFFTDEDFFRTLGKTNPSMLQRFSEFLKGLYYKVSGKQEKAQILKAQQTIRKVYQEYAQKQGNIETNATENTNLPVAEETSQEQANNDEIQYILTDNQGRELTNEQQEFFKDVSPEVKDENGNLKVLYHGSNETDITVFKKDKFGNVGITFLTDDLDIADTYRKKQGKRYEVYANIKNPLVIDGEGKNWNDVAKGKTTDQLVLDAYNSGKYDGVVFKNIVDRGTNFHKAIGRRMSNVYVTFNSNQIKNIDNTNPTTNEDIRYSLSEGTIEDKINSSMTMEEAKDMVQRVFVLNDIKNLYDGKYKNGEEWLAGEGIDEVVMYAENTELVIEKYLNPLSSRDEAYYNGDYTVDDILTAYQNGSLTGEIKQDIGRIDTSKDTGYKDDRFYAPKDILGGIETYELANQRVTNNNREQVYKARADFIINAHNKGYTDSLGLTSEEVNKKLKSWANYPKKAMELSQSLNENVSRQNQWTGLENSSIVNTISITDEEMSKMVKEIKGDSNGFQRHYITSTMLAIDTHIDYSPLTFDFEQGAALRQNHAAGDYDSRTDVIRIGSGYQNTVAHEIGHYIDYSWGNELFGRKDTLSSLVKSYDKSKFTTEQMQFLEHFNEFQESIEKSGEQGDTLSYGSSRNGSYWQKPTEVFARFVGKFTEWVKNQATNNRYGYEEKHYKDRFTESQYREFVKILQEKSALDTTTKKKYNVFNQELISAIDSITENQRQELYNILNDENIENIPTYQITERLQDVIGKDAYYKIGRENIENLVKNNFYEDTKFSLGENGSDYALYTPKTQFKNKLSDGLIKTEESVVEENLPYTEDVPIEEPEKTPVEETKENTKEIDLGDKSVLNNTINRNSSRAKEKSVKVAKGWLNLKDSNKQEFKDSLDKFTRMTQEELLTGDSYEEIRKVVDRYSESEVVYTEEDIKDVKNKIRNSKIKVTDDLKAQITDYGYFRKSNMGKLKLGKEGTYIDVLWKELSELYPHHFSSEVLAESDMLYALSDFMNEDYSVTEKFSLDEDEITEITNDIYDVILDNALNLNQVQNLTEKDNELKKMKMEDITNIKTAETVLGNQEDYFSSRAEELFNELKGLKKGVRASNDLGRILNLGYRWSDIKAALSNIKWKPGMEVNSKNSDLGDIETTIKKMLDEEYKNKVQDLIFENAGVESDLTKEEVARLKRFNYAREVETLKDALESTSKELEKNIIEKQAEYDNKKNKDTAAAQKILQQISSLKIRKANIELDYNKRIGTLIEKVKNFDVREETRRMARAEYRQNLRDEISGLIENASKWADKKFLGGLRYSRETAQRNMVDMAGDLEGNAINEYVFNPVQEHEASKNRRIKEKFKSIKELDLNLEQKYEIDGEKVGEDDLVRRYIENSINKTELDAMGVDSNKIINAADTISEMLESLFTDLNVELKKMGLPEVEHRKDYFPHGAEDKQDTFITKLASVVGIELNNQELPTEIAGKTDEFKPNRAWNGHFLRRTGNKTNVDAIGNLEKYIAGVEDIIAHTEDIQKVRALSQEIRNQFTDEETQAKIDAINNNENLSDDEKDDLIKEIYKREDSQLSGLVTWLDEYANVLSNKKSFADRDMERKIGRNAYTSMANIEGIIAANTIGGNASVSLTNFAPITQALATTKGSNLVKAALDVLKNDINTLSGKGDTTIVDTSDFLTNRFGTDSIGRQTWKDKVKNIAFKPMEIVDNFTSEVVVRAKYYENLQNGMDTYEAMKKADKDSAKIMSDRSKGALPTIFNEKNPITKLLTMFQVEPNNIISNYTKDMSRDAESKGQLAYQYTKLALGSYVFNSILMGIRGGNEVLPDPIRFVQYLIKALTGDDEEREQAGSDMLEAITGAVPFVSNVAGFLGMEDVGRVPISSALPDLTELVNLADDEVSGEYKAQVVRDEILKPLSYFLLPTGSAQVWKTIQGIDAVASGGSYKYAKDGELKMQFPVEDANAIDYVKAGLFGKYSLDEAKTYIDSGFKSLSEKQTQAYEELNLPYAEYLEYTEGISNAKKEAKANDESQTEAVYDYIYNLPLDTDQKNSLLNSTLGNSDTVTDKNGYIKYVDKNNKAYWYDEENNTLYNKNYNEVDVSKLDSLTKYSNEKDITNYGDYSSLEEFTYANNNPSKYSAIIQITNFETYNEYKDDIEDISDEYSEKMSKATNSKQKTAISNQKKNAIRSYINSLNLNKYQKVMLEKLAAGYSIKNYKSEMQKYINSLDLSKEEKEAIDSALFD